MKYPELWRKFINAISFLAGCMVLLIAALSVFEAVKRRFLGAPTSWTLNTSSYLLIWVVLIGSSYAFQEHGHVAVDMLRDIVDKASNRADRLPRRIMAVVGYIMSTVFISIILYGGFNLTARALRFNTVTTTTTPIPIVYLYSALIAGSTIMLITLIFIILDLFAKGDKYL